MYLPFFSGVSVFSTKKEILLCKFVSYVPKFLSSGVSTEFFSSTDYPNLCLQISDDPGDQYFHLEGSSPFGEYLVMCSAKSSINSAPLGIQQ